MTERNKGKRLSRYTGDYIVFDLETTGIHPERDTIIEISAIKVKNHEIVEQFTTLVNPGRRIPPQATAVNGITNEMVADAPDLKSAMEDFLSFVGEGILVGHNIHTFDMNFVYNAAAALLKREVGNDYIDTLYMARKCLPGLSHHRLVDVASYFQVETEGAHRALFDCMMNQRCYEELGKLMEQMAPEEKKELSCPVCGSELILRKGRYGMFYGCTGFPRCRYTRNA